MLTPRTFGEHLATTGLWPADGRVLVGYSGGADSAALVHLLAATRRDFVAAHLHHGMRDEADKELELCAAFCDSLNIQFISGRADVPALGQEQRVGLEEAGRIARYTFLRQAAPQLGCIAIATAHTRTDHVETVLLHVIRGSGRRGLGGIAVQSGDLIRPLLPFDREETRAYCDANGLWYHDDPANIDSRFARSRLRNEVFPALRELNSAVNEAIARLAAVMREEDVFLDGAAAAALEHLEIALNGSLGFLTRDVEIGIDLPHFRHLSTALLRRAIRLCFETLGSELDFAQTEVILEGIMAHSSGAVTAERGAVVAEWTATELAIRSLIEPPAFDMAAPIPGRIDAAEFDWTMEITEEANAGQVFERAGLTVWIDLAALGVTPIVRSAKPGDRLQPLGFSGTRKLSDLFGEASLTVAVRHRLPILVDEIGPIWVPNVCLAERVRVKPGTKRVLKLTFGPAREGLSGPN